MKINKMQLTTTNFYAKPLTSSTLKKSFSKFVNTIKTICEPIPKEDCKKMYNEFKKNWILYR